MIIILEDPLSFKDNDRYYTFINVLGQSTPQNRLRSLETKTKPENFLLVKLLATAPAQPSCLDFLFYNIIHTKTTWTQLLPVLASKHI
jgi:hypothetical protein